MYDYSKISPSIQRTFTKKKRDNSYKKIKITDHAAIRAKERLGVTKEQNLQKIAHAAKYTGIPIWNLNKDNYKDFNISLNMFHFLKSKYHHFTANEKSYYYKGYVYVFGGDHARVLITVIPEEYKED